VMQLKKFGNKRDVIIGKGGFQLHQDGGGATGSNSTEGNVKCVKEKVQGGRGKEKTQQRGGRGGDGKERLR